MKIALIREKVNRYGGAEKNVVYLAKGFLERGHEVHIFAGGWDEKIDGAVYHQVRFLKWPSFVKPCFFTRACAKMISAGGFDIVQSFDRTLSQDIYRAGDGCHREWLKILGRERGLVGKLLIYLNPKNLVLLRIEKRLFTDPRLKKIIANSRMVKEDIIRNYGVSPEKIAVIYNGIENAHGPVGKAEKNELRKKLGLGENDFLILFAGSNFERKGLRYLIEAVKDIEGAKVVVVGKGDEARYRKLAASNGCADRIFFLGFKHGLEEFYEISDIFVLPTLYDPFSNVTLEAMGYGLPVITTPSNGAGEIIEEGKEGFIAAAATLREKIVILCGEGLREEMGRNAFEKAKRFSLDRVIDQTLCLYNEVFAVK